MCIIFVYINPNPSSSTYKLILASNRDEFISRPTKPAEFHQDIFCPTDQTEGKEGGTWLAVGKNGRISSLLNRHVSPSEGLKSRGFLVQEFISHNGSYQSYCDHLERKKNLYDGFSFVMLYPEGNTYKLSCISNCDENPVSADRGVHGFSNCRLQKPYLKVNKGVERMKEVVDAYNDISKEEELLEKLEKIMSDATENFPDERVLEFNEEKAAKKVSSIFVDAREFGYATRTITFILVTSDDQVIHVERNMVDSSVDVSKWTRSIHKFVLESSKL